MIHHISIAAREPQHVAEVLAELMNGKCSPFPPLEGAFMAANGDANGTMIEVYPERTTLNIPDRDDQGAVVFAEGRSAPKACPFHLLLSVPLAAEEVARIGAREGWRTRTFGRGIPGQEPFFHVIEFWLENRLLVEVATPPMAQEYLDFMTNGLAGVMMSDPRSVPLPLAERAGPFG